MTTNKSQLGRPTLPDEERRDFKIEIRVTASEKERLREVARAEGKELSVWVRETLLERAPSP